MKKLLLITTALVVSLVWAQALTEEDILGKLEESATTLEDASFTLQGQLFDLDGQSIELEIELQVIPELQLARAYFVKPDALADNFIVLDDQTVYNYLFLTNQVQVFEASDPDALGGLFPEGAESAEELQLDLNLERLFVGWEMTIESYRQSEDGNIYTLRFINQDEAAQVGYVLASVSEESWTPQSLAFFDAADEAVGRVVFADFKRDQGLEPGALRDIPADAEVIDER